ncbi:MAG: hypothetical protein H0T47_20020 [Planctomycetaceae bacterium]|nr:hypothetical protein [Planctomycetaceae bacterium]
MADLKNPKLIYAKGILFLLSGLVAAALILVEHPDLRTAFLLAVAIWCFARAYYFAFYVVERYVDPTFKFSGLGDFAMYVLRRRK